LTNGSGAIEVSLIGQEQTTTNPVGILTSVNIIVRSLPSSTEPCGDMSSEFWQPGGGEPGEPAEPLTPGNRMLRAPITAKPFCYGEINLVQWLTRDYDQVVHIQFTEPTRVLYNLYLDLGKLERKQEHAYG
jgi:hypothetical protein